MPAQRSATQPLTASHIAAVISRPLHSITYPTGRERATFKHAGKGKSTAVTPFQWSVYDVVKNIPAGRVSTYGGIARRLDTSPRAVGNALRRNPFAPLVPCHRVVAGSGRLGGFFGETTKGGAVDTKAKMLREEGVAVTLAEGGWAIAPLELKARLWTGDEAE